MEPDFKGYATKADLKCSDGRTITAEAFKHMGGMTVPLVWQHNHNEPTNVLGHVLLEARADGIYAQGFFNNTPSGKNTKALVEHGDIKSLSIWANGLVEKSKQVLHGVIREVSLVLSGANPGALIDYVRVQHSDDPTDVTILDDEAIIYPGAIGLMLIHGDVDENETVDDKKTTDEDADDLAHAGKTVKDVYDSLDAEQQGLVNYLVAAALQAQTANNAAHSGTDNKEGAVAHKEGTDDMGTRNVFDQNKGNAPGAPAGEQHVLTHDAIKGIVAKAVKGGSFKAAVEEYALAHGIENLDVLFPDAKTLQDRPEFIQRRIEWVDAVINGTRHSPFSRVKSIQADLTQDDARAKGYITGSYKKEEWFNLLSRVTTPTTVYKKQKLDRDDIVDITDFDVVVWLKGEMRMMLMEEIARAILVGDGRDVDDDDKIKDPGAASEGAGIRAIVNENELYATTVYVNIADTGSDYNEVVEAVLRARRYYKGTGTPTFYTTEQTLVEMLLAKDTFGRRRWNNAAELAASLRVSDIVAVEVMEDTANLVGIIVNLSDYNVGTDRGGEVNMFDDFDIDYNQYKYLIETRLSGALVKVKSALVIKATASANVLVAPNTPTFDKVTGVITIPTQTGVVYHGDSATGSTLSAGAQTAIAAGATKVVVAVPASGYYFATSEDDQWSFKRNAA